MKEIKVVYNACYGGFGLSKKATLLLQSMGVEEIDIEYGYLPYEFPRHDPRLVQVVEALGEEANGPHAKLEIWTLSGNKYRIDEYDGNESVSEPEDVVHEWVTVNE